MIFHTNNGRSKRYISKNAGRQNCRAQKGKEFISVRSCIVDGQRKTTCPETGKRKTKCDCFNIAETQQRAWRERFGAVGCEGLIAIILRSLFQQIPTIF